MPRSTKGRAAARGLDARLSLQHASCLLEMLHSKQLRSIKMLLDSNHGIYRRIGSNLKHFQPCPLCADRYRSGEPLNPTRRANNGLMHCNLQLGLFRVSDCAEDRSIALLLPSTPVEIGRAG